MSIFEDKGAFKLPSYTLRVIKRVNDNTKNLIRVLSLTYNKNTCRKRAFSRLVESKRQIITDEWLSNIDLQSYAAFPQMTFLQ